MAAPHVVIREIDLSTRVPTFPGLYVGLVLPDAKKGPVNTAVLSTNDSQFLDTWTPNGRVEVGYDNAYFVGLAILQKANKLWSVRPSNTGLLYGGAKIEPTTNATANSSLSAGEADPEAHTFSTESILFAGKSPGKFNDDIRIRIYNYKASEAITFNDTTDIGTVAQRWGSGFPVRLSTTGTLPEPLSTSTIYFAVNISDTTIKLALSESDALAGSPVVVNLTSTGSGTHSIRPAIEYVKEPNTFLVRVFKSFDLNNPIEEKICSKTQGAKDGYNRNIYVEEVFKSSNLIQAIDNVAVAGPYVKDQIAPLALVGGADGTSNTDGECIQALQKLANPESTPLTVIVDGGRATVNYHRAIIDLAEVRKDCVGILSTPFEAEDNDDYLNKVVDYRRYQLNANTSYAAMYSSHTKIYDKFNDREIYISPDGFIAGLISETAANYDLWWPVAGFRRGIMNVIDVRRRWTKGEMDYLYDNGINPIRFAPNRGIVVWGQKTLLSRPSALDRLNVRLLLVSIEPALAIALEDFMFEINDEDTRSTVKTLIDAAMDRVQARRGVYSFSTVCDTTNNTPDDEANYRMNVHLFVKPSQSIEEIPFTLVITRNSMDFKLAQASV